MQDEIEKAEFVLVVVTEAYERRFRGREKPNRGLGVRWEGAIITTDLYYATDDSVKFIPVLVDPTDVRLIPPPMALTTHHHVGHPGDRDLAALLRQLQRLPAALPEALGTGTQTTGRSDTDPDSSSPNVPPDVAAALEPRTLGNPGDTTQRLAELIGIGPKNIQAEAALALGRTLEEDERYVDAVKAYRRCLEIGPDLPSAERAAVRLQVVLATMNSHFGPDSAVASAFKWLNLVRQGAMDQVWRGIDQPTRLALVQSWIHANINHPELAGEDKESLAADLARAQPSHRLRDDFFATQLSEFRDSYQDFDPETWGAAETPRRFELDLELVILMETDGEPFFWEAGTHERGIGLILRRFINDWYIAGYGDRVLVPGWPPSAKTLPLEGIRMYTPGWPKRP